MAPFTQERLGTVPLQKAVRGGVAFKRVRQTDRSKTGPEIGQYGKVSQKSEQYGNVLV